MSPGIYEAHAVHSLQHMIVFFFAHFLNWNGPVKFQECDSLKLCQRCSIYRKAKYKMQALSLDVSKLGIHFGVLVDTCTQCRNLWVGVWLVELLKDKKCFTSVGKIDITCMIENIPISYVNAAMERLQKNDVKDRFVICYWHGANLGRKFMPGNYCR